MSNSLRSSADHLFIIRSLALFLLVEASSLPESMSCRARLTREDATLESLARRSPSAAARQAAYRSRSASVGVKKSVGICVEPVVRSPDPGLVLVVLAAVVEAGAAAAAPFLVVALVLALAAADAAGFVFFAGGAAGDTFFLLALLAFLPACCCRALYSTAAFFCAAVTLPVLPLFTRVEPPRVLIRGSVAPASPSPSAHVVSGCCSNDGGEAEVRKKGGRLLCSRIIRDAYRRGRGRRLPPPSAPATAAMATTQAQRIHVVNKRMVGGIFLFE